MATNNIASTSTSNPGNSFSDVVKKQYDDTSTSEFAKSLTQASNSDDYDSGQLVANAKAWANANSLSDDYVTKTLTDYNSYTDEQKQNVLNDPTAWLNGLVSAYTPAETTESETKQESTATPSVGKDNFYYGTNTKDYSDTLRQNYEGSLADYQTKIDQATANAVSAAENNQTAGSQENQKLADVAKRQYDETIATREAIEANNGNRDGIGHEQYGSLEQAYNARLGELKTLEDRLKTQTVRAVADARAQGDYAKANAELATAQAKLKALYTEQMRIDTNLRSNYEWQTELDQEDKSIQAKQDATELEWQRSIGMSLLQAGLIPDDSILQSMGLSKEMAEKIALYMGTGAGGSGGGGGSSGGSGGSGSYTSGDDPGREYEEYTTGSLTDVTKKAYALMAAGDYDGAAHYVNSAAAAGAIGEEYRQSLFNTVQYGGVTSAGYQNYANTYKSTAPKSVTASPSQSSKTYTSTSAKTYTPSSSKTASTKVTNGSIFTKSTTASKTTSSSKSSGSNKTTSTSKTTSSSKTSSSSRKISGQQKN